MDVIAIRKSTAQPENPLLKRGDLFDIILIQVKGGSAKGPTAADRQRLREIARVHGAATVAQFAWKKGQAAQFFILMQDMSWEPVTSQALFG